MKSIIKKSASNALNFLSKYIINKLSKTNVEGDQKSTPLLLTDFNHYLHELRSFLLASIPAGAQTVCSVGCSGTWYFDWFAREYGSIAKHIGVEYFMSKPVDLPSNVEWLEATAGDLSAIPDASVDLLLSGQNLEHLPLCDLIGFFQHAWRVLRPGGWLVIDSPNGSITSLIGYQQPEHIAEYTLDDMRLLLPAAGFHLISAKGAIRLRDKDGTIASNLPDMNWTGGQNNSLRRALGGLAAPDDSFVWWVEAQKAQSRPDAQTLSTLAREIFVRASSERCNRVTLLGGRYDTDRDMVTMDKGKSGPVWQGPYIPLFKGQREVEVRIFAEDLPKENVRIVDCKIIDNSGEILYYKSFFTSNFNNDLVIKCQINVKNTKFGVEILLISSGSATLHIPLTISIS